jgi:hypothetical protein
MLVILGSEKSREVMVKPPCDTGRGGVFEIDDGVFVADKLVFVKERAGAMDEAVVLVTGSGGDALAMKSREERG